MGRGRPQLAASTISSAVHKTTAPHLSPQTERRGKRAVVNPSGAQDPSHSRVQLTSSCPHCPDPDKEHTSTSGDLGCGSLTLSWEANSGLAQLCPSCPLPLISAASQSLRCSPAPRGNALHCGAHDTLPHLNTSPSLFKTKSAGFPSRARAPRAHLISKHHLQ